ncbi:MAG: alkaline phosphatase family protein [Polyangiaceae bacterium]|nr:alkaline phosphatase family protein [Polyangiaceae bacterium]
MSARRRLAGVLGCLLGLAGAGCGDTSDEDPGGTGGAGGAASAPTTRIAFGSCMHQSLPKPVLDLATASAPDLFVFLGDNIYGDTDDMAVLAAKYAEQAASPELQSLRAAVPTIATWDDHDYGRNDAGKEYPYKVESKGLFLDFWQEPASSSRRTHDGVYTSYLFWEQGGTVQVILLDTRWFRDPLDPNTGAGVNDYQPTADTSRTLLGAEQWQWLETELATPADVRIIGTSIQFGHEYNGWESWTNMPHERQHLVDVLRAAGAEVTVFISGDVHWGELSRFDADGGYPLYDLTSSGITEEWPSISPNQNRIGEPVPENNYGFVEITWGADDDRLALGLVDVDGVERVRHEVAASALR